MTNWQRAHHSSATHRNRGLSVRLKFTLSYAGVVLLVGMLLLAVVWLFLLRYVPDVALNSAQSFAPNRSDLVRAFVPRAATALACLLVCGLAGGWLLAGRMLAPLDRIADGARAVGDGTLTHRIQMPGRRDEFRELADAFDTMVARLSEHVEEQQRFAANASHELRTPLAITQTLLDVARNDPNRNVDEVFARLRAVNARAIDLTEALLLLSRSHLRSFTPEPVDLSLLAEEAVETLLPIAEKRGVTVAVAGDVATARGDRTLLLQLVTNLVQNAIVHNLHENGTLTVTTAGGAETARIIVENTGPVVDPAMIPRLTEPFQRATERTRTAAAPGIGLGLAIVSSIAQAHSGTLALTARPAGGLRIVVELPAAGTPSAGRP